MNYWLVKSDAATYSWNTFVKDGYAVWDGVRNFQARNNLKLMKKNDMVLFYHSVEGLAVVGVAKVVKEHYSDPTAPGQQWVVVDLKPMETLANPVTLKQIKEHPLLQNIALIKQARLSVMPLNQEEFEVILKISK